MTPFPRSQIRAVAERYGARNIRIFGSVARGDDRPDSDLDLLIDLEEGRSLLDRVDVHTIRSLSRYFRDEVLAEAVSL